MFNVEFQNGFCFGLKHSSFDILWKLVILNSAFKIHAKGIHRVSSIFGASPPPPAPSPSGSHAPTVRVPLLDFIK